MTPVGRPPKPADEALTEQVSLNLTAHQLRVLDKMVEHQAAGVTRQEFLRELIRKEYQWMVSYGGMEQVKRDA